MIPIFEEEIQKIEYSKANALTPDEMDYLTSYNVIRDAFDHMRANMEQYSTKHVLEVLRLLNSFDMKKIEALQLRLVMFGEEGK